MLWCLIPCYFYNTTAILAHTFPSDLQVPCASSLPPGIFGGDFPQLCHSHFQNHSSFAASPRLMAEHLLPAWVKGTPPLFPEVQLNQWEMRGKAPSPHKVCWEGPKEIFSTVEQMPQGRRSLCCAQLTAEMKSFLCGQAAGKLKAEVRWLPAKQEGDVGSREKMSWISKGSWSDQRRNV